MMGQYWNFFNIDRREVGERNGLMKFGEFFFHKQGFLVRSITAPYGSPEFDQGNLFRLNANVSQVMNDKGLLSLPNEMLLGILECASIDDGISLCTLALTCHRLFELAREKVEELRQACAAPWAWCRVVCLGDYSRYEDVPKTLFTDAERAEIEKSCSRETDEDSEEVDMSYAGVYHLKLDDRELSFLEIRSFRDPFIARFTPLDRTRHDALMGITYPPHMQDWALCNIIKKEYVRASEIAKLAGRPDDPQPFLPNCRVDLGHALLTRIAWSFDDSMAIPLNATTEKLHRGQWAGDRFVIATLRRLGSEIEDWTDVSEAVVHDLTEIYKAMYGEEWLVTIESGMREYDQYELYWTQSDGDDEVARRGRGMIKRPPRGSVFYM